MLEWRLIGGDRHRIHIQHSICPAEKISFSDLPPWTDYDCTFVFYFAPENLVHVGLVLLPSKPGEYVRIYAKVHQ